jgi:hypothetical protein
MDMSITDYLPVCEKTRAFISRAEQHRMAERLVPTLTKNGHIAVGIVVESQVDVFDLGAIFGNEFGPYSVDTWGLMKVFSFNETQIRRISC